MARKNTTQQKEKKETRAQKPNYASSKQNKSFMTGIKKWPPILNALLFAGFAFYMLAIRNADYLYAAQERSLFLFDRSFYDMIMVKPGALMTYLGCFFTQFFFYPQLGSAILIAIWLVTYFLTIKAFKLNDYWSILALLPIASLLCSETIIGYWLYYNKSLGYWFAPSVALLVNMLAIWLYRVFRQTNIWINYGFIVVWCFVGYWATGWLGLIGTLIMGLTDILTKPKKQILTLITAIVCIIVVPFIGYQFFTQMRINDAWWVGMPIFETETVEATRPWYPFISLIIILLSLAFFRFSNNQQPIEHNQKTKWSLIALQLFGWVAIVGCALLADFDNENYHAEFRIYRAIDEGRWQDALDESAALKSNPTREIILLRNIALNYTGKTGDYMFKYNNVSIDPYVYDSLDVHMAQTNSPLVYLNYARLNFATRWSIENSVEHGFTMDSYKILTRCALATGEIDLARKYINILKKTLFYKSWAEHYEPMVDNPQLIASAPEFTMINEYYKHFRSMLDSDEGLVEMYLLNYFSSTMNKDSKQLQETTLAFALLSKDIQKFWPRFFLYAHLHPGEPMPIHYQEAAFLYGNLEHEIDISKLPFDPDRIINRYATFNQMSNNYLKQGKSTEEIAELLKPMYGDTFWWFYFFCRGMTSY